MQFNIPKKAMAVIIALGILPAIISTKPKTSGGHPSSTGGPGEETCAQSGCHSTATVDPGTTVNTLIFPTADSTYVPGQTYSMSLYVQRGDVAKFGFELMALEDSNDTNIGELIVTDASRTHIISGTVAGKTRKYITHSADGTSADSTGYIAWSFDWKAPSENVGAITFYYITNCTNDNGANTGDALFKSSFQIKPQTSSSINDIIEGGNIAVNYSQNMQSIEVGYTLKVSQKIVFTLFDIQGKTLRQVEYHSKPAGKYTDRIELEKGLKPGIYKFRIMVANKVINKNIFIQ